MKVGIVGWLHESNTFIRPTTQLHHFESDLMVTGDAVRDRLADSHHEIGGFFQGLATIGVEAIPVFAARATPYGPVSAQTFDAILARIHTELDRVGPLDGLLLAPHGAMVSEQHADADGFWMGSLRQRFGPRFPIMATLDPHANLSPKMVVAADALVAYRTNPHLDQRERGMEAASLMARTLRGEIQPVTAAAFPPLAINIERQRTDEPHLQAQAHHAESLRHLPGVLSTSLILGFPYADVADMGTSVVVVTDHDSSLARKEADRWAGLLWDYRHDFAGRLISPEAAIDTAMSLDGPVGLLDMGDNVGGGSPGDGTILVHLIHQRMIGPSFACLHDPDAVCEATGAGINAHLRLRVGGKSDDLHGEPLEGEFLVTGLFGGRFTEPAPRHGGIREFDQGPTAILRTRSGLTIMVTTCRTPPFSLNQLTAFGIDPAHFRLMVIKGVHAPVAAYSPVCRDFVRVNTPGVTSADLSRLVYHHRRNPLYPFEQDMNWRPPSSP
jgi:microcystin degradation protein MlrC